MYRGGEGEGLGPAVCLTAVSQASAGRRQMAHVHRRRRSSQRRSPAPADHLPTSNYSWCTAGAYLVHNPYNPVGGPDGKTFLAKPVTRYFSKACASGLFQARVQLMWDRRIPPSPLIFLRPRKVLLLQALARPANSREGSCAGIEGKHPLTTLSPRDGHPSTYEAAFRCWFLEQAARQRYGKRYGLMTRLSKAFAGMLACSMERIKQIRAVYSPFLHVAACGGSCCQGCLSSLRRLP